MTSHRNRAPNSNALTGTRRVTCKIEYYPRNVPPQNPSFGLGGKKDIELSYDLPPRQEQTFGRSRTTLTTVVRIAPVACRSAGLHRTNITQFMLTHRRFLAFYTPTPCLRLWFYYPVHCRLQLSHILLCPCPAHCKCHPLEVTDCNYTYPKKLKRGGDRQRRNPERRLSTIREWWNTNPEGFHSSWQGRRRTKLEVGGHGRSQGEHLGLAPTSVQSLLPETLCPVSSCQGRFYFVRDWH